MLEGNGLTSAGRVSPSPFATVLCTWLLMVLPFYIFDAVREGGVSSLGVVKVPPCAIKRGATDRLAALSLVGRGLDRGSIQGVIVVLPCYIPVIMLSNVWAPPREPIFFTFPEMPRKGERKRSLFTTGGAGAGGTGRFQKGDANPSKKKAHVGAHADDDAEEPAADAVPPTPVSAPVQQKEKSPPLVSPPPIPRKFPSAAAPSRQFNVARSVSRAMK